MLPNKIIEIQNLNLEFGEVQALTEVNLDIYDNELLAIIGPNGAGKTSLLNCLNGFYRPQEGEIYYMGKNIITLAPHRRACLGMGRTFQGIQLYSGMTTLENIMSGRHMHMKTNFIQAFLHWPWVVREENEHRRVAEKIIDFLEMEEIRNEVVSSLGYGLRKRIDLGRALALEPKILIMDEPMAGMNVEEKEDMARFILDIRNAHGITVVLVEHDMEVVMDISDRVAVLEWGHFIAQGKPEEVQKNEKVIKAYLGTN